MWGKISLILFAVALHQVWTLSSEPKKSPMNRNVAERSRYRGAVLEMIPFFNSQISPLENELENVRIMTLHAAQAKQEGADIMVFPEQVFTSRAPTDRPRFVKYCLDVPDPDSDKYGRCREGRTHEPLNQMRCAAKASQMYLVFNVPEKIICYKYDDPGCKDGFYLFSTNVVLDRNGTIIAKYRKQNVDEQPQLDIGDNRLFNHTFTTDFGVLFSQFIGIDIMYENPALDDVQNQGVLNFVMPTNWIDILPFYTAPQVQYSWSRGLGVNLLAAGIHEPGVGAAGSGIYTGASNILNSVYIYNDTSGTRVLVNDVTTTPTEQNESIMLTKSDSTAEIQETKQSETTVKPSNNHLFLTEIIEEVMQFGNPIIGTTSGTISGIYYPSDSTDTTDTFEYEISYDFNGDGVFYFVLYSGLTGLSRCKRHNQLASLIYCPVCPNLKPSFKKTTQATFNGFNLTVSFMTPNVFPSIIDQDFQLVSEEKWDFTKEKRGNRTSVSIVFKEPIDNLYAVSLMGRRYERDPPCNRY